MHNVDNVALPERDVVLALRLVRVQGHAASDDRQSLVGGGRRRVLVVLAALGAGGARGAGLRLRRHDGQRLLERRHEHDGRHRVAQLRRLDAGLTEELLVLGRQTRRDHLALLVALDILAIELVNLERIDALGQRQGRRRLLGGSASSSRRATGARRRHGRRLGRADGIGELVGRALLARGLLAVVALIKVLANAPLARLTELTRRRSKEAVWEELVRHLVRLEASEIPRPQYNDVIEIDRSRSRGRTKEANKQMSFVNVGRVGHPSDAVLLLLKKWHHRKNESINRNREVAHDGAPSER